MLNIGEGAAVGDFNKDGRLDVAVGNDDSKITVLLGKPQGGFGEPASLNAFGAPKGMVSADFNHDGNLDLIPR